MTTAPTETGDWSGGWLRTAQQVVSPNANDRPAGVVVDLIVLHSISLPPGQYGGPEVEQLFTNQLDWSGHPYFEQIRGLEVSAHFFVRRDGQVMQFVDADRRAWHAGVSCWRGRERCNDDSIGIELEGLEGQTFEDVQYRALTDLCRHLAGRYPIAHIAGHEHIAPGRKLDPGPGFDWARLQRGLAWDPRCFPECVIATFDQAPSSAA
ncbi:1,6-anhydro-N-acetylmuramyl-L-alanine amidase AmpD [Hydrogenophaga luteola]|uniref:1,6-anhydro-N-acetylmuramyl-L-alanine amidase AmpD n=1 Tax=Hydrogenophaga luteola TaxID=1591122 RepID=A0ABV7W4M0_9BURK